MGYTNVCNIGTFETYDRGFGTSADVMLDTPGTVDALQRLRDYPWLSVGWHTHFWGSAVSDPARVRSLLIPGTDRFRHDLRSAADVDYDEILLECRAQVDRCVQILGRAPDVGVDMGDKTPFAAAVTAVSKEYGMAVNYGSRLHRDPQMGEITRGPVDPRFQDRVFLADNWNLGGKPPARDLPRPGRGVRRHALAPRGHDEDHELPEGAALMHGFHPGYVDYYVAHLGDYGPWRRWSRSAAPMTWRPLLPAPARLDSRQQHRAVQPARRPLRHARLPEPPAQHRQRPVRPLTALSLSKKVTGRWPFFSLEILELRKECGIIVRGDKDAGKKSRRSWTA